MYFFEQYEAVSTVWLINKDYTATSRFELLVLHLAQSAGSGSIQLILELIFRYGGLNQPLWLYESIWTCPLKNLHEHSNQSQGWCH